MKKKLNIWLLISFIIGVLYMIYSVFYWGNAISTDFTGAMAAMFVVPHLVCTMVAVVFNGLGLFMHKKTFALTGAILYAVAMVLFPMYFMFVLFEMILSFIGYARMRKELVGA